MHTAWPCLGGQRMQPKAASGEDVDIEHPILAQLPDLQEKLKVTWW
jgi:hypothetical protein